MGKQGGACHEGYLQLPSLSAFWLTGALTGDQNNFPVGNHARVRTHTYTHSMINSKKSPASGAGNVKERKLM